MTVKLVGLVAGAGFGFVLSWAQLTDPAVIRSMLLLREAHVFLVMGTAMAVASVGCRLLKTAGVRAWVSGDPIRWSGTRAEPRHLVGSVLFGAGWSVAGTCPGPVAAMIGQGKLSGLAVGMGILIGVSLQQRLVGKHLQAQRPAETAGAAGL